MESLDLREQEAFRARARAWLEASAKEHEVPVPNRQGNLDSPEEFARYKAWNAKKAGDGWAGLHWPKHLGGRGLTRVHSILYEEEESRFAVPRGDYLTVGPAFAAPTLMAFGNDEVNKELLPKILSGEEFWCQLFSEPVAGSDLAGIRTRAVRDGDDWVVNGQKVWTTYAQWADWAILVTRHDFDVPKHKGLTYFYVDMRSPGIEVRPVRQISGESHFNEVFLTNVRIPDAQRLGAVGEGWQVALTTLMNERLGAGFSSAPPSFRHIFDLARHTEIETGPAIADSSVRSALAQWYIESRGLELIRQRTISLLAQGQQPGPEASISKIVSASKQQLISSFGLDLLEIPSASSTPGEAVRSRLPRRAGKPNRRRHRRGAAQHRRRAGARAPWRHSSRPGHRVSRRAGWHSVAIATRCSLDRSDQCEHEMAVPASAPGKSVTSKKTLNCSITDLASFDHAAPEWFVRGMQVPRIDSNVEFEGSCCPRLSLRRNEPSRERSRGPARRRSRPWLHGPRPLPFVHCTLPHRALRRGCL